MPTPLLRELDKDGSGTISIDELGEALKRFGIFDDAKKLLETADTNGESVRAHVHDKRMRRMDCMQVTDAGLPSLVHLL